MLHTYKVSRELQNMYCCREGIMLRSKDKTICRTRKHSTASFLSDAPTLYCQEYEKITLLYQERLIYTFIQSTFLQKKTSAHKTQMSEWQLCVSYVKNHFKATIRDGDKTGRYQYLLWRKKHKTANMLAAWLTLAVFVCPISFKNAPSDMYATKGIRPAVFVLKCQNVTAVQQWQHYHVTRLAIYTQCHHKTKYTSTISKQEHLTTVCNQ